MYMKTKERVTELPIIDRVFWHKMHKFRDNGRESVGLVGRECTDYAIIGAKKRRPLEPALTGCEGSAGRAFAKNADLKVGATIMAAFL